MSREKLDQARDLILHENYSQARVLLEPLRDRSSTARRWLAQLDEMQAASNEPAPPQSEATPAPDNNGNDLEHAANIPTSASGEYNPLTATFTHDARRKWEYREIVLRNWDQHLSNIEYALEQGSGEKITVEDAYVRLLNENGAQGWEVIAEEILPQQYIRLLMKRPAS